MADMGGIRKFTTTWDSARTTWEYCHKSCKKTDLPHAKVKCNLVPSLWRLGWFMVQSLLIVRFCATARKLGVSRGKVLWQEKSTLAPGCICTRYSKNKFWNVEISWNKILRAYLHIVCVHKVVSRKIDMFCDVCKNDKKMSREKTYFSIKPCLSYIGNKRCRFSVKWL